MCQIQILPMMNYEYTSRVEKNKIVIFDVTIDFKFLDP